MELFYKEEIAFLHTKTPVLFIEYVLLRLILWNNKNNSESCMTNSHNLSQTQKVDSSNLTNKLPVDEHINFKTDNNQSKRWDLFLVHASGQLNHMIYSILQQSTVNVNEDSGSISIEICISNNFLLFEDIIKNSNMLIKSQLEKYYERTVILSFKFVEKKVDSTIKSHEANNDGHSYAEQKGIIKKESLNSMNSNVNRPIAQSIKEVPTSIETAQLSKILKYFPGTVTQISE